MFQKFMKMMNKKNKGFTLVELMVVVVIIGILVAIAIPIYTGTRANAQDKACMATLRTIDGAIAQFQANGGTVIACADGAAIKTLLNSYLQNTPKCPSGGTISIDGTTLLSECTNHGTIAVPITH